MNHDDKFSPAPGEPVTEDSLAPLFRHASARLRPPPGAEGEIRATVRSEWERLINRRRRQRRSVAFGLAATILLAVTAVLMRPPAGLPEDPPQLARVARQSGNIFISRLGQPEVGLKRLAQQGLAAGQVVHTSPDARLALNWLTGASLRLNENSELVLLSGQALELTRGQLYVDTVTERGASDADPPIEIRTRAGVVRHLGTQYITAVNAEGTTVTVREGRVNVALAQSETFAKAGEQLRISEQGGTERVPVSVYGELWGWAESITPVLQLDGLSAWSFVQWAGRETGRRVVFDSDATESLARETLLRGTVDLQPLRALELILQTSDLDHTTSGGDILIRQRSEAR